MPKPGQKADPALGKVLRALREKRKESRETLAHRSGVTLSSLADIEQGRANPSWATVQALCDALDTTMAKLAARVERAAR